MSAPASTSTPLARAQSFIAMQLARPTSYRVEHARLLGTAAAFHWRQFLVQLFLQSVPPLMLVLLAVTHGQAGLRNAELWVTQGRLYAQFVMFAAVCVVLLHWATTPASTAVVGGDCALLVATLYIAFRATIAVKYAYMPPSRYKRWYGGGTCSMARVAAALPDALRTRENLLAWMAAKEEHVRAELQFTAQQLGIDLHSPAFRVAVQDNAMHPATQLQWLHGDLQHWYLVDVVSTIMTHVKRKTTLWPLVVTTVLCTAFHGVAAFGLFGMGEHAAPSTPGEWIVVLLAATMHVFMVFILSVFACCAYMDYQRQHLALVELEALVSYTPGRYDDVGVAHNADEAATVIALDCPPKVSLMLADNVAVFLLARRVLMSLGLRYRRRLRVYISAMAVCVLAICATLLTQGLSGTLRPSRFVWMLLLNAIVMVWLLFACMLKGSATNKLTERHVALLDARVLEVDDALYAMDGGEDPAVAQIIHQQLERCRAALQATAVQIQHDYHLRAVTILGTPANPSLVRNVVVFGTTLVSLLLRVLLVESS